MNKNMMTYVWMSLAVFQTILTPLNAEPLKIQVDADGDRRIQLEWDAVPNIQYTVEFSEDLQNWSTLKNPLYTGTAKVLMMEESIPSKDRFYRLVSSETFTIDIDRFKFHRIGNEWIYQVTETTNGLVENYSLETEVKQVSTQNGVEVIEIERLKNNGSVVELEDTTYILNDNSEGLFEVGVNVPGQGTDFTTPPVLNFPAQFTPGEENSYNYSSPLTGTFTQNLTITIEAGPITVPAGPFSDVLKAESALTGSVSGISYTGIVKDWYAPGIGLIKQEIQISFPSQNFNQSTVMELSSAFIGSSD